MKNLKAYKSETRYNDLEIVGKTQDGEYLVVGRYDCFDAYQPIHADETSDGNSYLTNVGHYPVSNVIPLTDDDKAFIDSAYESDSMMSCPVCNVYHDTDDYQPDFQFTDDGPICKGDCFTHYLDRNLDDYIDKPNQCIPLKSAEQIPKLKHLERFIGGWVDGRGGYYAGEYTREGVPAKVLEEYRAKYPNAEFVFSHDESGQFQTYFSIWRVLKRAPAKKAKKKGRAK